VTTIEHLKSAALTRRLPALLLITGALCQPMAASAQEKQVEYTKQGSGPLGEIFNLTSLAIVDFAGPDGKPFAQALGGELRGLQINGQPAFTIRNELSGPLLSKARTPEAGRPFVIQMGQKLGVKGVVWGEINEASVTTEHHQGQKVKTPAEAAQEAMLLLQGKPLPPPVMVDCVAHRGAYTATISFFQTEGGKILHTKQINKNGNVEICGGIIKGGSILGLPKGGSGQAMTPDGIIGNLRKDVIADLIGQMKPPVGTKVKASFKTKFPDVADEALRKKLERAASYISNTDAELSCDTFIKEGHGPATEQYSLMFNIAACMEVRHNEKAAKEYYLVARKIRFESGQGRDSSLDAALHRVGAI